MTPGEIILALTGLAITTLGTIAVFRGGAGDRIDKKREIELTRLDKRLTIVENDSRLVAVVAWRAVRYIESLGGPEFAISKEELDALERTRPLV